MQLACSITTPEKLVFDGAARRVVVPAADGEMGILPRHAPLIALLGAGELRLHDLQGGIRRFYVNGGFIHVLENRLNVLATQAEDAEQLDPQEAENDLSQLYNARPTLKTPIEERGQWESRLRSARIRAQMAKKRSQSPG
jgi:F-type H+-transporting ATPase subunit epsilon